jgi:hypothetical protein
MKKSFIIMTCFLMFYAMGFAQNATKLVSYSIQSTVSAKITWLKGETIDVGKIEKGIPKTVTFEFKNTGNAPLIISSANGQCGAQMWNTLRSRYNLMVKDL